MKWWLSVMLTMLVWGNAASATLPAGSDSAAKDKATIQSWMAHLNFYFPGLKAEVPAEALNNPQTRLNLIKELQVLEDYMQGEYTVPRGSLKDIACGRPVCDGGGDGGKCRTCKVDELEGEQTL